MFVWYQADIWVEVAPEGEVREALAGVAPERLPPPWLMRPVRPSPAAVGAGLQVEVGRDPGDDGVDEGDAVGGGEEVVAFVFEHEQAVGEPEGVERGG